MHSLLKHPYNREASILPSSIFTYLSSDKCSAKIRNKLFQLADEISLLWGVNNKRCKIWIKRIYSISMNGHNANESLIEIEKYLKSIKYYDSRDKRIEIINKMNLKPGYIYILSAEYMPNIVKMGMTKSLSRSPYDRARELKTTGVPGQFKVEFQRKIYNPISIETDILNGFDDYLRKRNIGHRTDKKANRKKETFCINKKDYVKVATNFVQNEIRKYENTIFTKVELEIYREKILINDIKVLKEKIIQKASVQKLIPLIESINFQYQYLYKKRGLSSLYSNADFNTKLFYIALNNCIDWLNIIFKSNPVSSEIDTPSYIIDSIIDQFNTVIRVFPKKLSNKPFK